MDLCYSAEQELLRQSAMRFVAQEYDFSARRRFLTEPDGFSRRIWSRFAELGWLGMPIAESAGGFGGDAIDLSVIMEALGSALVVEPYLPAIVAAAGAIEMLGSAKQSSVLEGVVAGQVLLSFAHSEPASASASQVTRAIRSGSGWILNGTKSLVLAGAAADYLLVSAVIGAATANTNTSAAGLFVVPAVTAGLRISRYPIVDGRMAADITLHEVKLGPDALLGHNEQAAPVIEAILDRVVAASCSAMVGALDYVLQATNEYTGSRVQFGKPIRSFQVIQHRLAQMKVLCTEARAIALLATLRLGSTPVERARAVSAAKVNVGRAARWVVQQAVQLHGGMGVTDELNIATHLKQVAAFEALFGSGAWHCRRYRRLLESGRIQLSDGLVGSQESAGASG